MKNTTTRRQTVRRSRRGFGLGIVALAGTLAAGVAGCEQQTTPPPAAPAPAAAAPAAAPASTPSSALPSAPGSSGPLGNMRDNPTSYFGRTAQMGKDTAQAALNRDAVAGGMAAEMSGEAVPLEVAGLHWSVPAEWQRVTQGGGMRAAEFAVAHPEGGEGEGQAIWFYFGDGQGGSVQDNIARWSTLVLDTGGNPAVPDVETLTINGTRTTLVAMDGTYRDGIPGQAYVERPGYTFRGAIFEGPSGNVFVRLTGPQDLMQAIAAQWQQLVQGTRKAGME